MSKMIFLLAVYLPYFALSQSDSAGFFIPMKNGRIGYENKVLFKNSLTEAEIYDKAVGWFKSSFGNTAEHLSFSADNARQTITGNVLFKIITSNNGHYYLVRLLINIEVFNHGYSIVCNDFYEKPIEPGITNDYSKLEYRWWDFRKGKPWSTEDRKLFSGIAENMKLLMTSLQNAIAR